MKTNKLVLILAIAALIGGFVLIMNSKLIGVLRILAAFGVGAFYMIKMRKAAGYKSDDVFFNGIGGTGRQQSEVIKKEKERI